MYNLLIGGSAGQGVDTTVAILEKLLKISGYHVFTLRDFMSRVRGGHNFSLIRFGTKAILSHSDRLDGIIALNDETVEYHKSKLNSNGFILCDSKLGTTDSRAVKVNTFAWYNKRIYELDGAYDASDKLCAIQKSMEFGDRIPLGILYREQKSTFHQKNPVLKSGMPLLDRKTDPAVVYRLIKEFI